MSDKTFIDTELHDYILGVSLREPAILARLREETASHPRAEMQITPEQGQFLALLVRATGAKKVIEVGVFTGYSSLSVALALPADGHITACDVSEEFTSVARRYWQEAGVTGKIALHLAPAAETLDRLLEDGRAGSFDFAFIDADKPSYPAYFEKCLSLLRTGGLIAVDNTLQHGRVADTSNNEENTVCMRAFNQALHKDQRIALTLLPYADGITLAVKL